MNLHDWIDELCDALDIEAEADEALLLDLAGVAHDNVHPAAGPVTAFLLGVAAGEQGADPDRVESLAARAQALAEAWDRPADARDELDGLGLDGGDDGDDEVPPIEELDVVPEDEDSLV